MTAALLGSVLGSVTALVVAAIGFYQWRRTGRERSEQKFSEKRAATLEELVRRLQELQIVSRRNAGQLTGIKDQEKGLNEFLIENRLWLDSHDDHLARSYVAALSAINAAIMSGGSSADLDIFIGTRDGPYSDSVAEQFGQLAEAEAALVERARNAAKRL